MSFQENLESLEANHLALQLCNGFNQKPATKTLKVFWASHRGFTRSIHFLQGREPTNADLHRFAVLGWAVEYLQAGFFQHFWGISLGKTKSAR